MENRRISTSSNTASISNLRHIINPRTAKEKMAPALKRALELLRLQGFDGLENHFLGTDAFLKPWSQFRDRFLLVQPGSLPRASEPDKIRGMDILWFYTNFSEGELRYDPRADDTSSLFTTDETKYGSYDRAHWGVEEYEKMTYAWLLQEFRVGKARNPFGFQYFELQNVCTAWQVIFKPIIDVVRESYDSRGRRYYGRLARFIEERYPSRVAFPEGNVMVPQSASPYRIVSYPRRRGVITSPGPSTGTSPSTNFPRSVTIKEKVALEKELRDIYPKYGQVVEKPKGGVLSAFLAEQKARIMRKRRDQQGTKGLIFGRTRGGRESPMFMCRGIDEPEESPENRRPESIAGRSSLGEMPQPSPTKTKKDNLVPFGMFGYIPSPRKAKNPLHGITRRVSFSDAEPEDEVTQKMDDLEVISRAAPYLRNTPPRSQSNFMSPVQKGQDSDSVYSSIRISNPFTEDESAFASITEQATSEDVLSPMGHPSAIPKALFTTTQRKHNPQNRGHESPCPPSISESRSRIPSYLGTGYEREIKPDFIADKMHTTLEHNAFDRMSSASTFSLSEIPGVTNSLKSYDPLTPQRIPWPGQTPTGISPEHVPWPGQTLTGPSPEPRRKEGYVSPMISPATTIWPRAEDTGSPPPIPAKHPARAASFRSSTGSDLAPPTLPKLLGPRIVSKENIRGHLSNISRDISEETLRHVRQREVSPTLPPAPLKTFNSHMFPRQDRKGMPMGGFMERSRVDSSGSYEMKALKEEPKQ
ncbi:hypothetical protein N0V90_003461 [Kalmusia sp. IMI 367209]|nr:hypothetical protein N0V90_003461 [Kalmusia sp. IMI 367209]